MKNKPLTILGIETSCDETAAAVIRGEGKSVKILSNVVASQIDIHKKYGGVVPEIAAREHVLNILPVVHETLARASLSSGVVSARKKKISLTPPPKADKFAEKDSQIGAIAVTVGPGLITSLIVGVETAKSLAYAWNLPLIGINHIEGHIYANFIDQAKTNNIFPSLVLTVSGGHNLLVLMKGHGQYKIIGETLDDAAGEAFDKAAAMLSLGYPGGPAISAEAEKLNVLHNLPKIPSLARMGKGCFLPRPMLNKSGYDFSFSGLKTALLYQIQKDPHWKKHVPEYCREFQQAVIDVLVGKTLRAAKEYKVKTVMLSGGVSANRELRKEMGAAIKSQLPSVNFQLPDLKYTTDNAAMVAVAGYFRAVAGQFASWQKLKADPNLELK